jgi:hypothetical protein
VNPWSYFRGFCFPYFNILLFCGDFLVTDICSLLNHRCVALRSSVNHCGSVASACTQSFSRAAIEPGLCAHFKEVQSKNTFTSKGKAGLYQATIKLQV